MRAGCMAVSAGLALFSAICAGDSISVGGEKYDNVYIAETPSNYLVCFPETGRIVSVSKTDVPSENIHIDTERDNRRSLFEQWVAKRNEINGYSSLPATLPSASGQSQESTPSAPSEDDNSNNIKKIHRIASPPPPYYSPEEAAQQARDDDLKAQRQAMIEAQRRQREAAKNRMLNNRQVYTSEHARGVSVQWNNSAQWNNGGSFGY